MRANLRLLFRSQPIRRAQEKPVHPILIRRISRDLGIAVRDLRFHPSAGVTIYRLGSTVSQAYPRYGIWKTTGCRINFPICLPNTISTRNPSVGFADLDIQEGANGWLIGTVPDSTRYKKDVYYRLFTPGKPPAVNFSDSTHIWLNSNAIIKYPSASTDSIHIFIAEKLYSYSFRNETHL